MKKLVVLLALGATVIAVAVVGPAPVSAAKSYTPQALCNVAIEMSDGVTLRADIGFPVEKGRWPLVLEITGYNKNPSGYGGGCSAPKSDLVTQGYATMTVDDRGTGASEGFWDRYGPRTRKDYGELLDWIQDQPWSDGKVATTGTSYSAGTAIMTAIEDAKRVRAGKPRAMRAVWANLIMSDMYRDYPHVGGFMNMTFTIPWLGLVAGTSAPPPTTLGQDPDALRTWADHWTNAKDMQIPLTVGSLAGNDKAYDSEWYRSHSPGTGAELIDIPVAWTGGWFDIFQRGEYEYWRLLKRAPVKKMWMNPIYHGVGGANHFDEQGFGTQAQVVQKWWDRWLKGARNGVEKLPSVNLWMMGQERWWHGEDWPKVSYQAFYPTGDANAASRSVNNGTLALRVGRPGQDVLPFTYATGACTRSPAHWGLGEAVPPCAADNRSDEMSSLTYTTEALGKDLRVAGPAVADFWAEVNAKDTAFVVRVTDVAPSGESVEITGGWLIARHRAIDRQKSLYDSSGRMIRPYHPFTKEAEQLITPNLPTRYAIEIYPTGHVFKKGHRLRVTVTTSDFPALAIPQPWLEDMAGGEVRLLRGREYPSRVLLPVVR